MKLQNILIILGVVLLTLTAGCAKSPETTGQQQKQVLTGYLEGLRDKDFVKLQNTTHPQVFADWPQEPAKLKEFLAETQKSTGKFKTWEFENNPFIDELNGQAIVRTTLVTEKYNLVMDFDLRKLDNNWGVYGIKTVKQVPLQNTKGTVSTKMIP